jgi:pyrroloquinoline-quinone synthase
MNYLIQKIEQMFEERSLLKHPFYQTWSDGKLTPEALAGYSKEYYQLVKAVPKFMEPLIKESPEIMKEELYSNQQEETSHIELWERFAYAMGISYDELINYEGLKKTNQSISELSSTMTSFESGSAAMYAFEKEIPKISQIKLDGLAEFYGIASENATEYFKQHTEADIRHAASWQKIIEQSSGFDNDIIHAAKKSISSQNLLLDSCFEEYC